MNRIYRRIWNATRQCWVVASELAAARGKFSRVPQAAILMAVSISGSALANPLATDDTHEEDAVVIAPFQWYRASMGNELMFPAPLISQAGGAQLASSPSPRRMYALVTDASAADSSISGDHMLVVGTRSSLIGNKSVGYGNLISSKGDHNTAVGFQVETQGGYATSVGATSRALEIGASAFGNNALAARVNTVALGSGARAQANNAVALGANSYANEVNTVSVGTSSEKRRIVNVEEGRLNALSADAVTGSQLFQTNARVGSVESKARDLEGRLGSVDVQVKAATNRIDATTLALGKGAVAESGSYGISTAIGNNAKAYNGRSVALGFDALAGVDAEGNRVTGQNAGVSIGANTRSANGAVATGFRAVASGNFSIAVGGDANAAAEHATAMGYLSKATAKQSTALGRGSEAKAQFATALGNLAVSANTSAVALGDRANARHDNAVALGAGSVTASVNSVSVGSATLKRKIQYIADGAVSNGSTDAITGNQLFATNQAVSTAQSTATSAQTAANAAKADATKALAETAALTGLVSQTGATGNVRLGGKNSGTVLDVRNSANASRKVAGVADGTVSASSNEAVNGKQLNATNVQVAAVEKAATAAQADATVAKADAAKALVRTGALEGLVSQTAANGNVRLGEKNSGTVLDVRNSANAGRKLTGVADGVVSGSSYEAVNGRQLNATNEKVVAVEGVAISAAADATLAKADATKALAETAALGGLVAQVSASGDVRLGEKNGGTTLNVRNSANANRKISGVADGALSASSAEAVSGRQLYSSNARIAALEDTTQFLSIGTAPASERAEAGPVGVAVGNSAKTGSDGGTAVGTHAKALGRNSVAIGRASVVHEDSDSGFALGAGAEVGIAGSGARGGVAIGAGAKVGKGADGSLAIGEGSQADEAGVASFGSATTYRRLVNIARGTADHNATTVSQLKDSLATLGGGAGMDASGNIIAPTYAVQGGTQNTVEDALMALDGAVISTTSRVNQVESQLRSVFQDTPSVRADGLNQLTLAGTHGMVISNVANGLIAAGSRDAVNGGQLHSMQQQLNGRIDGLEERIDAPQPQAMAVASVPEPEAPVPQAEGGQQVASAGEGEKPAPQPKSKKDDTPKPQVDTAELEKMLARANEYTDGAISNFERRLDKMDKRFNRMAAMSSAQTAMAMNTAGLATYNRLGAGVGYSEGESAMAVGYQRVLNEKGSATFSLNGAFTNSGERSMGVGVGIGW
ncbi:ESPR-type extended signal peptide-containing protein [Stenotrophomonas maltophilia]|uniref:ESPR-type extended signal peptide-containing protein n=1 Tax=Stenotrophomonas maltophilia TaxID=40324 RepID=UPI000DAA2400|nr:ESPR-type extended signal peptide-containing protein [Stenotrophomonas maltophilia]